MTGRIAIVHTSFMAVAPLTELFQELAPEVELRHVVDDSLLPDVIASGEVTEAIEARVHACVRRAADSEADLIFSQCSSVGEAVGRAAETVSTPVVRIDSAMSRRACELGRRIGLAATLPTTLGPSKRLIEQAGASLSRAVEVVPELVEGAFDLLEAGDRASHDARVAKALARLVEACDVVVCAQGTMAPAITSLGETRVPILTSPRLGVEDALARLAGA